MTDANTTGNDEREIPGLDETTQAAERDVRIDSEEVDDLPVTPPESMPRGSERAMAGLPDDGETIDQRIAQEVPDPDSAYGAPGDGGAERTGDGVDVGVDEQVTLEDEQDRPGVPYDDAYAGEPAERAAMHLIDGPDAPE